MPETPEQRARREIDADLTAAGWLVQSRDDLDLTAGRGIAIREFAMKSGFGYADDVLYVDCKAVGAVEAKPEGTLSGVEAQSAKYAAGLPDNLPAHKRAVEADRVKGSGGQQLADLVNLVRHALIPAQRLFGRSSTPRSAS